MEDKRQELPLFFGVHEGDDDTPAQGGRFGQFGAEADPGARLQAVFQGRCDGKLHFLVIAVKKRDPDHRHHASFFGNVGAGAANDQNIDAGLDPSR